MAVLSNTGIRAGASGASASGYKVEKSLRFEAADTAYLSHTPSSDTSNKKQFTISFWTKVESDTANTRGWCNGTPTSTTSGGLQFYIEYGKVTINSNTFYLQSNRRLRDPAAWYHIVLACDTTLSTANDRMKVWVNNERITSWASNTPPAQNSDVLWNTNVIHRIGGIVNSSGTLGSYLSGYLAEFYNIDGQTLDPSSFGEENDNGKWVPKEYTGNTASYGTNGFHFKFNGADLGADSSGKGNNWTANNLVAAASNFDVPCVSFDGTDDYLQLADSTDFDFGTSDFTIECFARPNTPGSAQYYSLVMKADASATYAGSTWWWALYGQTNGTSLGYMYLYDGSTYKLLQGSALSNGKWHHIAVVRDGDTARLYHNGVQVDSTSVSGWTMNTCSNAVRIGTDGGGNYDMNGGISNVRIVNGTCLYPNGTTFTVPSRPLENVTNTKLLCCQSSTEASSATVAHTVAGSINTGTGWSDLVKGDLDSAYGTSDRSVPFNGTASNNTSNCIRPQNSGEWLEMDFGSQFNSATSVKIYGQASLDGATYNGSNENLEINGTAIGATDWYDNSDDLGAGDAGPATFSLSSGLQTLKWGYSSGSQSTGYLYLGGIEVDGTLLTNPLIPSGSMNTFEGATTLSDDSDEDDATSDSPADYDDGGNGVGTYPTWNPLWHMRAGSGHYELAQGNLRAYDATNTYGFLDTTMYVKSGKWYAEMWLTGGTISTDYDVVGIVADNERPQDIAGSVDGYWYNPGGEKIDKETGWSGTAYGASWALGDIIGVAMDLDAGVVTFYKNGVSQGAAFTGIDLTRSYSFATSDYSNAQTSTYRWINCGQRPFKHAPPTGFKALNTYNLPDPVIKDPSKYFGAKTYTGDSGNSNAITGLGFEPDLVWIKNRDDVYHSGIIDQVRGDTKLLYSSLTSAQDTMSDFSFDSDGFTVNGTDSTYNGNDEYISWSWDAGTANTIDSSAYDGSNFSGNGSVTTNGTLMNTWAKAFDGKTGSYSHGVYSYNDGDTTFTFDTDNKPTWSSKFRIFIRKYAGACYINGSSTDVTDDLSYSGYWEGWLDITSDVGSSGTLSSIKVTDVGSNYVALQAIELDDKVLYDTPPSVTAGGLDSSVYLLRDSWSSGCTLDNGAFENSYPITNAFDGTLRSTNTDFAMSIQNQPLLTMTINPAVTITSSLYVQGETGYDTIIKATIGGTEYTAPSNSGSHTFTQTGSLTQITVKGGSATSRTFLEGIKIDGKILTDTNASYDTVPTIASTYRANPTAGFSIVNYTGNATSGATIAHGLNAKPDFAIFKNTDTAGYSWYVYHKDVGNQHNLYLNYTNGNNDDSGAWNDTDPDSNVFTLGNAGDVNATTKDFIAYFWSEVEGYSKFGTYQGDASTATDNAWLNCGFKPAFVLIKRTDSTGAWQLYDNARNPDNDGTPLYSRADENSAEASDYDVEFLSNGFKIRDSTSNLGSSGNYYVFAAFAEKPFKYSNAH